MLLPLDPDASARRLRDRLASCGRRRRRDRERLVRARVAAGDDRRRARRRRHRAAPRPPRGGGRAGRELQTTQIAVADEIAGAAELVMGKARGVPAAIVRGVERRGDGSGAELVMPRERDLFR